MPAMSTPSLRLAIPVVRTARLADLLPDYRDRLRFRVRQQVPGVLAVLERGDVRLQLWQVQDHAGPERTVVDLDACATNIFRLAADLVRAGGPLLATTGPCMQAWGTWTFTLLDAQGNEIVFAQRPRDGDEPPALPSGTRRAVPGP